MKNDKILKLLGAFAVLVLVLPLMFWNAWGLSVLWGWFVTPLFGLPVPLLWQIVGLLLFVHYALRKYDPNDGEKWAEKFMSGIFFPPLAVGIGWVIKTAFGNG